MLKHTVITDKSIKQFASDKSITELRCTRHTNLKFRYHKNRKKGTWLVWHLKLWHKVVHWPDVPAKKLLPAMPALALKLATDKEAKYVIARFEFVDELIYWWEQRTIFNAHISVQRKMDVQSTIRKHLVPSIGELMLSEVNKSVLDKKLIWPMQEKLAKSTVSKNFRVLKSAFSDAFKLGLIDTNPLEHIQIADFGDFKTRPKGGRLQPVQVPELLTTLTTEASFKVKVLAMLQLTLGTRIGETLKARWCDFYLDDPDNAHWHIPENHTKNKKNHHLHLPRPLVELLQAWKKHTEKSKYRGGYLFQFLNRQIQHMREYALRDYLQISKSEWTSHDLRKCARTCWAEQGVDFMVAEKLLNHTLGKVAETYIDSGALILRKQAVDKHAQWLLNQHKYCYQLIDTLSTTTA